MTLIQIKVIYFGQTPRCSLPSLIDGPSADQEGSGDLTREIF